MGFGGYSEVWLERAPAAADFPGFRPGAGPGDGGMDPGEPAAVEAQPATAQVSVGSGGEGEMIVISSHLSVKQGSADIPKMKNKKTKNSVHSNPLAVVLMSGGLDSCVTAAAAQKDFELAA